MFRRVCLLSMVGIILSLAIACGGGGPTKSKGHDDGRIFVRNDAKDAWDPTRGIGPFVATYFNEELGLIKTLIYPGETKDISQAVIKGGTKVPITLEVNDRGYRAKEKIDVTVDGNVTIRVISVPWDGTGHFEYEII